MPVWTFSGDDPAKHGLEAEETLGIVVPHRAQRAALRQSFPQLCIMDSTSGLPVRSAIETVERFQGGDRVVILVKEPGLTESYIPLRRYHDLL